MLYRSRINPPVGGRDDKGIMSGHSHWATIKHDKSREDAKRGQAFTKAARLITVAARKGGPDPDGNPTLRKAIDKARQVKMSNDLIDRAIKRATGGDKDAQQLIEVQLEGYGPGGIGYLVEALTDNKNRTVSEIRNIFNRHGGNLGEAGSAAYIFSPDPEKPQFLIPVEDKQTAEKVLNLAQELQDQDDVQEVYANFDIVE